MTGTAKTDITASAQPGASSSADLLRRAREGDQAAWAELVFRYTPLLRSRAAKYRLQEADALDAAQTTWLRLAEHAHRIQSPEQLAGWLATTVSRECLRIARHHGRVRSSDDVLAGVADPAVGPEQAVVDAQVAGTVREVVTELSPMRQRLLVELFDNERKPYAEISRDTGIPVGSIGPTRARTLDRLRTILTERGVTDSHRPT